MRPTPSELQTDAEDLLRDAIVRFLADHGEGSVAELTVNVRGTRHGAQQDEVQLVMGEVSSEWRPLDGLAAIDVWTVLEEFGLIPDGHRAADAEAIVALNRHGSCRLVGCQADLLHSVDAGQCTICQHDYAIGDDIMFLPCGASNASLGHLSHKSCLRAWLRRADSCPLCREQLPRRNDDAFAERIAKAHVHLSRFREEARVGSLSNPDSTVQASTSPPMATIADDFCATAPAKRTISAGFSAARAAAERRDDDRRWRQAQASTRRGRAASPAAHGRGHGGSNELAARAASPSTASRGRAVTRSSR